MGMRITWPKSGDRFQNKNGDWFTVLEVNGSLHIKIRFDEGVEKIVSKANLENGSIRLPKIRVGQIFKDKNGENTTLVSLNKGIGVFEWPDGYQRSCQTSVTYLNTLIREEDSIKLNPSVKNGDVFTMNCGSTCKVIEYINSSKIRIEVNEPVKYEDIVGMGNLKSGSIRNRYVPSLEGVGYLGTSNIPATSPIYKSWAGMLKRCYNEKEQHKIVTYRDCYVDQEWFDLGNFAEWFKSQKYQDKWHLDKDLLKRGNKYYCKEYCVFLPREINTFMTNRKNYRGDWPLGVTYHPRINKWQATCSTNSQKSGYIGVYSSPEEAFYAYKEVKEMYAKALAEKWKGVIDDRAIVALQNYTVSIDD